MTETITETVTTTTEMTATPTGVVETQKVEHEWQPNAGHHCTCEECQQFEEDLAHEIATLRLRLDEMENGSMNGDKEESEVLPEPKESETRVRPTEEAEEKKAEEPEPKRTPAKKRTAGVFF